MKQLSREIAMRLYNHDCMESYVYGQLKNLLSPIVEKAQAYDRIMLNRDSVDYE